MTFWQRIWSYLPPLLTGARVTIGLSMVSIGVATIVGLVVASGRVARLSVFNGLAKTYLASVRSTPELVQFYLVFYSLPALGIVIAPFWAAVIVLGLHYGAYLSEVFRGGILSIERGQWEAAQVLGMRRRVTWQRVVLPQVFRRVVPAWGNYFLIMFKATALASVITVQELFFSTNVIASRNFRYFELWTLTALIYLVISLAGSVVVRRIERRLARSEHG
jgi:polar amino acid transport system permease protein